MNAVMIISIKNAQMGRWAVTNTVTNTSARFRSKNQARRHANRNGGKVTRWRRNLRLQVYVHDITSILELNVTGTLHI